jgi:hypothetical protein
MKKIDTIFIRNAHDPKFVTQEINETCEWVFNGEGTPTIKYDGSACLFKNLTLYRRHRVKENKMVPPGWLHHDFDSKVTSGHGWAPITNSTADQYHLEALNRSHSLVENQTYELMGPTLQKNPENLDYHTLYTHGGGEFGLENPRTFQELDEWLSNHAVEGIVWHHGDGRMAKIKRRDFGHKWPT